MDASPLRKQVMLEETEVTTELSLFYVFRVKVSEKRIPPLRD